MQIRHSRRPGRISLDESIGDLAIQNLITLKSSLICKSDFENRP